MLLTPQFRLLDTFRVRDPQNLRSGNLLIYENLAWGPPTEKYLHIKMLTLNRDIVVPLEGFNWKGGTLTSEKR